MTDHLSVWLGPERVGDLVRERRGFRFHPHRGASRLSVADQADEAPWSPGFSRAWFDGLLPEEERRSQAEVEHSVDRGDSFGLLAAIGWECADGPPDPGRIVGLVHVRASSGIHPA